MCIRDSTRSDRIPTALYASETIMSVDDYKKLIPDELDDTFTAVSYTHLDVYKRQETAQPYCVFIYKTRIIKDISDIKGCLLYTSGCNLCVAVYGY